MRSTRDRRARRPRASSALAALAIAALAAAAHAATYRRAFITSTTGTGDLSVWAETTGKGLSGLDAADEICQVRAEAAGFAAAGTPVFRAWISTDTDDAWCHVQGLTGGKDDVPACADGELLGGGPWVRPDGVPFAGELGVLVTVGPIVAASITETGADVTAFGRFYSGTGDDGVADAGFDCSGWTVGTDASSYHGGSSNSVGTDWSGGASAGCDLANRLLCLEQGVGDPPPLPREPGALAFVTSASGTGDLSGWSTAAGEQGLAAGDAICRALAAASALPEPESFVAWLSTASENAADRLTIDGPWKRLDGIRIADTKGDLVDDAIDAPILYDEDGNRHDYTPPAFTGTGSDGAVDSGTTRCGEWTDDAPLLKALAGEPTRSQGRWTSATDTPCELTRHLYCFADVVTIFWDRFESGDACAWSARAGGDACP